MKQHYSILLISVLLIGKLYAQSDNCASPTPISVTANCSSPTTGTTTGATASIFSGCVGNADDDVWYQFTATAISQVIAVTPSSGMDAVVQLFSGTCASLTTLNCQDIGISGQTETIYPSGLTIGTTYLIRIYNYGAGAGSGNFTICITNPPAAPANNICGGATALTVNATCTATAGSTVGATQSSAGCVGTAEDDVWYKFVATNTTATITVNPSSSMDAVVQLYSGPCGSLSSTKCMDNGLSNGNEVINGVGLVVGNTYFIRVYDYYNGNGGGTFSICVTGPPSSSTPTNDNPCNAIALPAVTADCNYSKFTTTGATATSGVPAPSACVGGSGAMNGGYSTSSKDVWFSVVAPANGKLTINPQPGYGMTDAAMVLYSGTCGSLTQITCSDDHNYPGTTNDMLPYISQSGLTPGATYFIRYFGYGTASGNFGLCVSSPTNDLCSTALYICDLNGYSASTSAAFTPDRPCNMRGNNENTSGVDQPDGTNTGGIFGQGGSWGTGAPAFDVNINNNSWIRFTAGAATAVLNVTIGNCWKGNYPQGGIQMQIFSATGCCNFTPVSNFKENSTGFTITANSLTIGNDYFLMVDGFAGDICNYTISANSGVQFPAITATASSVCFGSSTTLTGPNGATSYQWSPGGATTQSINITPSTTITYTCIASGVCGFKQTLTKTITVNSLPTVSINSGNPVSVCNTSSVNLTASGTTSYVWNTGATTATISVSPSTTTSYTVTGTNGNGCFATASVSVTVYPMPSAIATNTANGTSCNGDTVNLIASGGTSYSWTGPNSFSSTSQNPTILYCTTAMSGIYTVTVTDVNGCTDTDTAQVLIYQIPQSVNVLSVAKCVGDSLFLTATGTGTINWYSDSLLTNLVQANSSTYVPNVPVGTSVTYYVVAENNGCVSPNSIATATLNNFPAAIATNGAIGVMCTGNTLYLISSGGTIFSWTGPNSFTSNVQNIALFNSTTAMSGIYTVVVTDANGCTASDTTAVLINQTPLPVSVSDVSTCTGDPINLVAVGPGIINWYSDAGLTTLVQGNSSTYSPNDPGTITTYYVVATSNGCVSTVETATVSNFNINASGIASAYTGYAPIGVDFTNLSTGVDASDNFLWIFGDENTATTLHASNTFAEGGNYNVALVITETTSGCIDTAFINVFYENGSELIIPNIFTPNGDGTNDIFIMTANGIKTFNAVLYDRWGIKMYEWNSILGGWDGRSLGGNEASEGTYFYMIKASAFDGKEYNVHGAFQLAK
ncbi:MAG: gliding motility-associated C-terminal domain-containing protein [Bacteroidota bacterium]|nr:gliding motility-associated C-terminal domain-containing protein [Bacteroidota bacterium]